MISSRAVTCISNLQNLSVLCSAVTFYALKICLQICRFRILKNVKMKLFVLRIEKNVRYAIICPFKVQVLLNDKRYIQLIIKIQFSELYLYRIMISNERQ